MCVCPIFIDIEVVCLDKVTAIYATGSFPSPVHLTGLAVIADCYFDPLFHGMGSQSGDFFIIIIFIIPFELLTLIL